MIAERVDSSLDIAKSEDLKNILVVCKSETDRVLIKSIFKNEKNYNFFEANDLKSTLQIVLNSQIDLILIDDILHDNDGYEVIDRLNRYENVQNIPKMIFMSRDYKSEYINNQKYQECNFIKKPYDNALLKSRVKKILNNLSLYKNSNSPFEKIIDTKLSDLKELAKIYKKFLDIDENILFLYDKKRNCAIEANKIFYDFFGTLNTFNRVLSSKKLIKKFIPKEQEEIYLNFYPYKDWHELLTLDTGFSFIVRILKDKKIYSFNIFIKNINLFEKDIYLIKLSNIYNYIQKTDKNIYSDIETKLNSIKNDLLFVKNNLKNKNKTELNELLSKISMEFEKLEKLIRCELK